ncbi:efflux RND transporter periplasmic adaptor subunit [bacterium]|nr:efflux RND transporter periplasmic adaptor subunit [bacterium]
MVQSRQKLTVVTVALAAIVLASVVVWVTVSRQTSETEAGSDAGGPTSESEAAPIRVEADSARIGDLVMRLSATGLTRALQEIAVSPKVGGQVVQLPIREGQFVRQGELLMKLDDRQYLLALAEANDKLVGAQAEFRLRWQSEGRDALSEKSGEWSEKGKEWRVESERGERGAGAKQKNGSVDSLKFGASVASNKNRTFVDLAGAKSLWEGAQKKFGRGEISEEQFLKATLDYETARVISGEKQEELMAHKTGLTQAAVAVQRAELNLSHTEIQAPFSGMVADLEVDQGQQVSAGKACLRLVDLSRIDVEVQVLESEIGLVRAGRKAEVTFPAYPAEAFHGRVVNVNPVVDPETKTTKVTVRLDNPDRRILPGMFAYAKLEAQIFTDRLLVPKDAIIVRDQRKLVFVIRDGLAKWCYVETGLENEEFVEVLSSSFGLQAEEMVITSGHYTLVHDARVRF